MRVGRLASPAYPVGKEVTCMKKVAKIIILVIIILIFFELKVQ